MYQHAAEFFDEHGEHGKADRERELADREARDAETGPREPAAGMKSHYLIRSKIKVVQTSPHLSDRPACRCGGQLPGPAASGAVHSCCYQIR